MNLEIVRDEFTYKTGLDIKNYVLDPNSDVDENIYIYIWFFVANLSKKPKNQFVFRISEN